MTEIPARPPASDPDGTGSVPDGAAAPAVPEVPDGAAAPAVPEVSDGVAAPAVPEVSDGAAAPAVPEVSDGVAAPLVPESQDGAAAPPGPEASRGRLADLVVISGFSGAGKSSVMNAFEDAGYFCVDNLPAEMIRSLADLFVHPGSKVKRACVVSDGRSGEYFPRLAEVLDDLASHALAHRLVFLVADEATLLARYKETRRRHPIAPGGSILDGIRAERDLLEPIRARADVTIDTSGLTTAMLRRKIAVELLRPEAPARLAVTFASFGHKHGPPRDADLAFDVRFLPNPHWELDLRPLTGYDRRVAEYVGRDGRLKEFYDHALPLLEYLVPQYVAEGRPHLTVAVGCTGGRHRSVVIAEDLAAHFRGRDDCLVGVSHRDIDRVPARLG